MAIYELVMKYTLYGEECNNRFYFTSPSSGDLAGGAEDLTGGFILGTLVGALVDFWTATNSVQFHTVTARSLYDDTDFFEDDTVGLLGLNAGGEAMASAYCLGFRSNKFQTKRNRGQKRFSGFGETQVAGNTFSDTVPADAVADALNDLVTGSTLGELYGPRVLLLDTSAAPVYSLFETEAEQRQNMSAFGLVWTANAKVTTQRTRLPGHGT